MYLWVLDHLKIPSSYHYRMIIVTILVPVILTVVVTYLPIDCLVVHVIIAVVVFLVWALFAVIVVALMVKRDMAEASQLVSQRTGPLAEQVRMLKEEHGDLIADLRLQVEDLETRSRLTLEKLGAELPPKSVSVRLRAVAGVPTASATVRVSGGSKWARLRRWFRYAMRRVKEVVYGKRERG